MILMAARHEGGEPGGGRGQAGAAVHGDGDERLHQRTRPLRKEPEKCFCSGYSVACFDSIQPKMLQKKHLWKVLVKWL